MKAVSMTGYGEGSREGVRVLVSSLNSKYLEVKVGLPEGAYHLEPLVRERVAAYHRRGLVRVRVVLEAPPRPEELRRRLEAFLAGVPPGVRPVIDLAELAGLGELPREALLEALEEALAGCLEHRLREGGAILEKVAGLIEELEGLLGRARELRARERELREAKLRETVESLRLSPEDRERLLGEIKLHLIKSDVTEELSRLAYHLAEMRSATSGRRLEFLAQEVLREAHTLGAKALSAHLASVALAMRESAEAIREMARNLE